MKTTLSPRDLDMLSAYLDGQLDFRRKAQLEKRLKAEPDLRAVYQDLERTRTLLRSAPKMKAPRSFKLTPQMVGESSARVSPRRIYPVFQLASAMATLLLIVVLAGDFLGFARPAAQTAPPAVSVMMEGPTTQVAEAQRNAAPTAPAEIEKLQQKDMALPTETANPAAAAEAAPMLASPITTTEITGSGALSDTQTLSAEAFVSPEQPAPEVEIAPGAVESVPAQPAAIPWFRFLEGGLALLAVVLGVAAFNLRRVGR